MSDTCAIHTARALYSPYLMFSFCSYIQLFVVIPFPFFTCLSSKIFCGVRSNDFQPCLMIIKQLSVVRADVHSNGRPKSQTGSSMEIFAISTSSIWRTSTQQTPLLFDYCPSDVNASLEKWLDLITDCGRCVISKS